MDRGSNAGQVPTVDWASPSIRDAISPRPGSVAFRSWFPGGIPHRKNVSAVQRAVPSGFSATRLLRSGAGAAKAERGDVQRGQTPDRDDEGAGLPALGTGRPAPNSRPIRSFTLGASGSRPPRCGQLAGFTCQSLPTATCLHFPSLKMSHLPHGVTAEALASGPVSMFPISRQIDWITSSAPLDRVDLAKVIRPRLGGKEPSDAYYRL